MKNHYLPALIALFFSGHAAASGSASYAQLYQDSIINTPEVNGNLATAQAYTDCHLMALGAFPETIQQTVFVVADETSDYAIARKKFSELVALEMAADDQRKQTINEILIESRAIGEACLADLELEQQ